MEKCRLCKEKAADKKGSHIVPHFLLKRIENVEGKTDRDYELGFYIEEFDTKSYFGRAILPDKLEEIYGTLSDEEIEKNKHPLVVDNYFCSDCEKRLSVIESVYSKTLDTVDDGKYKSGISSDIGLLFWMSVFWRMSIHMRSGVKLTSGENETLRRILNRTLTQSLDSIDISQMESSKDLKKITYKLIRCPKFSDKNPTFLLFHPDFDKPYSLLIDEYIVFLSLKNNYVHYKTREFFGIKNEIFDLTTNYVGTDEEISTISDDKLKTVNDAIIIKMKTLRMSHLDKFFNKLHVAAGGHGSVMPDEIRTQIMDELTSTEKKLGRKYTIQDLRDSTMKIMKKYAP